MDFETLSSHPIFTDPSADLDPDDARDLLAALNGWVLSRSTVMNHRSWVPSAEQRIFLEGCLDRVVDEMWERHPLNADAVPEETKEEMRDSIRTLRIRILRLLNGRSH